MLCVQDSFDRRASNSAINEASCLLDRGLVFKYCGAQPSKEARCLQPPQPQPGVVLGGKGSRSEPDRRVRAESVRAEWRINAATVFCAGPLSSAEEAAVLFRSSRTCSLSVPCLCSRLTRSVVTIVVMGPQRGQSAATGAYGSRSGRSH